METKENRLDAFLSIYEELESEYRRMAEKILLECLGHAPANGAAGPAPQQTIC